MRDESTTTPSAVHSTDELRPPRRHVNRNARRDQPVIGRNGCDGNAPERRLARSARDGRAPYHPCHARCLAAQFRSDVHSALSAAIQIGDQSAGVNSASLSPEPPPSPAASSDETANSSAPTSNSAARQSFTLILPAHKQIDYQVSGGSVKRTLRDGDSVVSREGYLLPADAAVKWEITSSDFNRQQTTWQASLLISYPRLNQLQEFSDRRELRIDATSGLQKSEFDLTAIKQP